MTYHSGDNHNAAMVKICKVLYIIMDMIMWLWWTGWGASKYCDIGLKKISQYIYHWNKSQNTLIEQPLKGINKIIVISRYFYTIH